MKENIIMIKVCPEDCPYGDELPYGIEYYDNENDCCIECEWFKTERERDKKLQEDNKKYGYNIQS